MALTNPKIFGLNIKTEFADVRNKNTALLNLGLNPLDLEIIKGSSNEGMSRQRASKHGAGKRSTRVIGN